MQSPFPLPGRTVRTPGRAIKKYHHRASAHSSRDLLQFTRFDQGMELTGKCQAPLKTILTILLL